MEEIINGLKQIKTKVDSGTITTVNGTETLLSKQLEEMIEAVINYTRCCTELKDKTGYNNIDDFDPSWIHYINGNKKTL